ncbi:hypothetical protein FQA39_LY02346 [Lamprigera yunnana]|nr:hypothetical protein FQA39_LY02346 [Lamprigera yunnana]
MAFKFVAFAALLAFANASVIAPIAQTVVSSEYDPNPQYSFGYSVNDAFTGDSKSQVETRKGDFVQGQYSLLESDGTKRIVDYASDPVNGFNAVVNKVPVVAPIAPVVKTVVAAPVVAKTVVAAAPVASAHIAAAPFGHIASPLAYSAGYYPYGSGFYNPYASQLGYRYPYGGFGYTGAW